MTDGLPSLTWHTTIHHSMSSRSIISNTIVRNVSRPVLCCHVIHGIHHLWLLPSSGPSKFEFIFFLWSYGETIYHTYPLPDKLPRSRNLNNNNIRDNYFVQKVLHCWVVWYIIISDDFVAAHTYGTKLQYPLTDTTVADNFHHLDNPISMY